MSQIAKGIRCDDFNSEPVPQSPGQSRSQLSVNISSSNVTVLIRFEQKITYLNLLKTSSLF